MVDKELTLMLIDDNDADNEYHQFVIESTGMANRLLSFEDSRKALEYFRNSFEAERSKNFPLPQLIFLDINMPALNGFELLDKLRGLPGHERLKDVKIFMLTGSRNPDDYNKAKQFYSDLITGFRVKPLTAPMFEEIVQQFFQVEH